MMVIHECHVLELRIGLNVYDHRSVLALLKQQKERSEKSRLERVFEPRPAMPVQYSTI